LRNHAAGKYDDGGLEALDYVIASASKHGVRLILSFIDNWKYYNGVDQFVDWCIPERKMPPPKESGGDTDTDVSSPIPCHTPGLCTITNSCHNCFCCSIPALSSPLNCAWSSCAHSLVLSSPGSHRAAMLCCAVLCWLQTMTDAQKRYEVERHALFFKEEACKQLYKDHVEFLVNRVNSVNGEH
jgi:hypothetical protein